MFYEIHKDGKEKQRIFVYGLGFYDLRDTFECGQCFRHECISHEKDFIKYMTVVGNKIITVGQKNKGELIFYDISESDFLNVAVPYFSLETDYELIYSDIVKKTDSEWLKKAAESARGIAILKQDPWETVFSFIISQNNNIPRIRKIIKKLCAEYGVNICLQNNIKKCPLGKIDSPPCNELCKNCGSCYTFPTASEVNKIPEKLLLANPGFRYKYLCDAAQKVDTGTVNLDMISAARSYEHTKKALMEIKGVGEKVASCAALFGFHNLEAFPIDVWMKRAIDEYFDGNLNPSSLGRYAGVAQQYIFHYIRNLQNNKI